MENRLVVTRADENISEMTSITHEYLRKYADICKADFKVLDSNTWPHYHYRILELYKLFETYDRILCLDSDILILKTCPNIFKLVPEDCIGTIYEDKGSRLEDRRNRIEKIQKERGNVGWYENYINTGVIIFSKIHRELFNLNKDELWMSLGFDDVELGFQIHRLGYNVYELPCEWNFMSMHNEGWNQNSSRFDAFIIHYAGMGNFYGRHINKSRFDFIKEDYLVLKKYDLLI